MCSLFNLKFLRVLFVICGSLGAQLCCFDMAAALISNDAKNAVVKIYTVYNSHHYHDPWQTRGQQQAQGSGCVISGQRILTNAHVVSDQTFMQVRRSGQVKKYTATVEIVGHDCDLAILKVADPDFFAGITPLELGDLPSVQDRIVVLGYPQGGDTLSFTEGVVSRIEHHEYLHSQANLLTGQIDAPINVGNSGGPVLRDNRIVGVAFQNMAGASYENIGYMVPTPVIRHFLQDIADGQYDGFPELGLSMQKLENPDLRRMFLLAENESGALVNKIYPDSPAEGIVAENDILLSIEGKKIENDGTIEFRPGERTYLGYEWQKKQLAETLNLKVSRNGERLDLQIPLTKTIGFERLVPSRQYDRPADYLIVGGLVFEPLTLNYLQEYGTGQSWSQNAPKELLNYYMHVEPKDDQRQVVLLVKVLADEINIGYHSFVNGVIRTINGKPISTMKDVVSAFASNQEPFHVIEDTRGYRLVLDRQKTIEQSQAILDRYQIPSDHSKGLKEWKQPIN